jgi:hypothetical protein
MNKQEIRIAILRTLRAIAPSPASRRSITNTVFPEAGDGRETIRIQDALTVLALERLVKHNPGVPALRVDSWTITERGLRALSAAEALCDE